MLLTTLVALTLAAAPTAAPAPAAPCQAATQTGTYRVTAFTKDSAVARIGMIVLENVESCLEATLITDDGHPAIIENVALKDGTLTGLLRMTRGDAPVKLVFGDKDVHGTIGEGKNVWQLAGRRTSDATVRVGDSR